MTTRRGPRSQHAEGCPDRLGGSICRLLEVRDLAVTVQALDAIDGMPVLNLKPYMREFGARRQVGQAIWFTELIAGYWNTCAASSVHGPGRIALADGPPPVSDLAAGRLHSRRSALC